MTVRWAAGTGTVQTAHFELTEFEIIGDDTVGSGPTRFEVHNSGAVIHNLVLGSGPSTPDLSNGESAVLDVGEFEPGVCTLFCSISGHREAGMETTISVEQGAEASGGAHEDHGDEVDWDALDDAMTHSILAFPAETEGKGKSEARADDPGGRDQGVSPDRGHQALGGRARKDRRRLELQRAGARTGHRG